MYRRPLSSLGLAELVFFFFLFFFQCMYIFAPGSWLVIHVLLWCSGRCHAGLVDSERSCRREREVRREESSQSFEKVARVWKVAA